MIERNIKDFFNELLLEDDFFSNLTAAVKSGDTSLIQSRVIETMIVDDAWIYSIENLLFSAEQIVKNPKKFIVDERNIVNVEKAKRTDSETVRHLASHTNYIRSVDKATGEVMPSKLLVKEMEEDLLIYENRFVFTLITRLIAFIEQRYTAIKDQIDTFDTTNLKMRSKFKMDKGDVEYDFNIKVRNQPSNKILLQKNHELLGKIEILRKRILLLKGTDFYKALSVAKPVQTPIMKTNIIRMHTDYKNCYKLWMFLSSYNTIGFSVEVSDKRLPVDTDYYDDLTMLVAISLKAMVNNNAVREPQFRKLPFNKRSVRKYRELRQIQYTPSFKNVAGIESKDEINQFYYDKLKELVAAKDTLKESDIASVEVLKSSFKKVFMSISELNNEMYKELLAISSFPDPIRKLTTLQEKQLAYKKQDELCKKLSILSKLKVQDLEKTLYRENTQKVRLAKLKFDYETALEKAENKKPKKKKKAASSKLSKEQKKLSDIFAKAEKDESLRLEQEIARQEDVIERERQRLLNLEKAREEQRKIREMAKELLKKQEEP